MLVVRCSVNVIDEWLRGLVVVGNTVARPKIGNLNAFVLGILVPAAVE